MEEILLRIQTLENELKKEREINRILQFQIADINEEFTNKIKLNNEEINDLKINFLNKKEEKPLLKETIVNNSLVNDKKINHLSNNYIYFMNDFIKTCIQNNDFSLKQIMINNGFNDFKLHNYDFLSVKKSYSAYVNEGILSVVRNKISFYCVLEKSSSGYNLPQGTEIHNKISQLEILSKNNKYEKYYLINERTLEIFIIDKSIGGDWHSSHLTRIGYAFEVNTNYSYIEYKNKNYIIGKPVKDENDNIIIECIETKALFNPFTHNLI